MAPAIDPVIGRYVRFEIDGVAHRVYFEEAGPEGGGGIPLVCLHTAGADSRQFRHLLADPAVTQRYRVLAFDMP
jgi:pimeloyl-ACP methyl ester carboxylesterase